MTIIISYLNQLVTLAELNGHSLLEAYKNAGVEDSTYYRNIKGSTELRFDTAEKIAASLILEEERD